MFSYVMKLPHLWMGEKKTEHTVSTNSDKFPNILGGSDANLYIQKHFLIYKFASAASEYIRKFGWVVLTVHITMILKNSIVIFVSSFNTPSQLSEKIFF